MGRDGFLVPLEMKKKTGVSTSWILLDHNGQETILDVDKYAVMRRVHIHARDLRILDPLLSYPSTILGREKVIVLNLEREGGSRGEEEGKACERAVGGRVEAEEKRKGRHVRELWE
ncbi:hypothetical protein FEM48_Zijuj12G0139400 [Ziziphus jujuba var. spinosa]|uniref:Uncharacterized protein n=1 Tax=Ziziphus jujuba var. spinosa TaxID=714518 RepID=A0A978UDQ9_ZIZJJ|nr:hypothetical protein FEM48_Zijuj12G0139400 [Ziziphus jujuba var. spinosa]